MATSFNLQMADEIQSLLHQVAQYMQRTTPSRLVPHGQHNELDLARPYLPDGPGIYVDVGAADAEECSNTYGLYREGWSGLLIEPHPSFWYRLLRLRPRDRLLPIAASNMRGIARMRSCESTSSLRPDWSIREHAEFFVETDTLANILDEYPTIRSACQLCSIDVEGWESQVLQGIDWQTFHPAVFIIEYRKFETPDLGADLSAEWEPIILSHGYRRVAETTMNYIYTNKPEEKQDGPSSLDCHSEPQPPGI